MHHMWSGHVLLFPQRLFYFTQQYKVTMEYAHTCMTRVTSAPFHWVSLLARRLPPCNCHDQFILSLWYRATIVANRGFPEEISLLDVWHWKGGHYWVFFMFFYVIFTINNLSQHQKLVEYISSQSQFLGSPMCTNWECFPHSCYLT